jgi:hypothetical protein
MARFMVIRTTLVVGVLVLTTGCAQMVWVKDGATQQQFSADQFDCKQKSYTMVGGYNSNNLGALVVDAPGFFNECMQSKGYRAMSAEQYQRMTAKDAPGPQGDGWTEKTAQEYYEKERARILQENAATTTPASQQSFAQDVTEAKELLKKPSRTQAEEEALGKLYERLAPTNGTPVKHVEQSLTTEPCGGRYGVRCDTTTR